jgi:hypothetical protein
LESIVVKVSVAIMAHRSRERHIPYLLNKLKPHDVALVWDRHNDRWETGRRSMLNYDPEATHHVVVQDDALVCEDFVEGVTAAVESQPDHPIAFYTGAVRPKFYLVNQLVEKAKAERSTWFALEGPWWGVAVCVPVPMIVPMVEYADTRANISNYDTRMARYFGSRRIKCLYSVPSLVSHRTGEGEPSLVPGRRNSDGRRALWFIGENESALQIEWTSGVVSNGTA